MIDKIDDKKPNRNAHREIMFDVIKNIYSSSISNKLAFKWWTICMFLHGLDRFSVDLDFDLIKWDLQEVYKYLETILSKYWEIIEKTKTKIILRYPKWNYPLKVEINTRIKENDSYENVMFFWTPILAMDKPSMFANKLYATFQRKQNADKIASRDLYDIWFFFKNHRTINELLLEERSSKNTNDYLEFLKKFVIENFHKNNLLLGLWELVNEKQKFFIKNKLIDEVLSQIDFYIRNKNN